jgi:AcrR family transcriptional regulator
MAGRPRSQRSSTAIVAAAIALLREHGYDGLRFDEVARVAGVGKSSLYARFPTRADLAAAALASLQRDLPPPSGELRVDLSASLRAAERNLAHVGASVVGAVVGAAPRQAILGPVLSRMRRALELGQARGALTSDADIAAMLDLLVGSLLVRVLLAEEPSQPWPERAIAAVLGAQGSGNGWSTTP